MTRSQAAETSGQTELLGGHLDILMSMSVFVWCSLARSNLPPLLQSFPLATFISEE